MANNLFIKQIEIGPMMNYSYLVGLDNDTNVVVIDVAWDPDKIIKTAEKENKTIKAALLTHTHFDHCNAVEAFSKKMPIPIYVNKEEADEISSNSEVILTQNNTKIEIASLKIECLHTPGHSPGSQCFLINNVVFTGDTLFVDSCGRIDLHGSNPKDMSKSLKKLASLPDNTVVYPGHNYGPISHTTIGAQKQSNYYMSNGI